jgi:predicted chitinase
MHYSCQHLARFITVLYRYIIIIDMSFLQKLLDFLNSIRSSQQPEINTPVPAVDLVPVPAAYTLTTEHLKSIMPTCPQSRLILCTPYINNAIVEADISTKLRAAAFLAQIAEESCELRYMEEIASGSQYEGRKDLGNTQPGDGVRYKGRSCIQITGRANYSKYGKILNVDLISNPELAATPEVGFRIACAYWNDHHLNDFADKGDIITITKRINGGVNGLDKRKAYYSKALSVLP